MSEICSFCGEPANRNYGRGFVCNKHCRVKQMRETAKSSGKFIPPYYTIETLISQLDDMKCPVCLRKMNWLQVDGPSTVITLQHDRSGEIRLICQSCNVRHSACEGDSFYTDFHEIGENEKRCAACKLVKPLHQFGNDKGGPKGKTCACKLCISQRQAMRRLKHNEEINARDRERKAMKRRA